MTEGLKALLQHYGALTVTLSHLLRQRPGTEHGILDEYYKALGNPLPDEPVLVVRISKDGDIRFLKEGEHDVTFENESREKTGIVTVWELPEDEFWFFRAFRPGLFDLDKDLPPFLYEMGVVNAYTMFEEYLSDLLRARLRQHPRLMGNQRKLDYEEVFDASSKDDLISMMITREVREFMYLPLIGLLQKMRERLGFRALVEQYDQDAHSISLIRNCLLHNKGKADQKLAAVTDKYRIGVSIVLTMDDVNDVVHILRKFAYAIDRLYENNGDVATLL